MSDCDEGFEDEAERIPLRPASRTMDRDAKELAVFRRFTIVLQNDSSVEGQATAEEHDELQRRIAEALPTNRSATRLSPWTSLDGYSAMRFVEGTNPNEIENRFAMIEKTPRVRIFPFDHSPNADHLNWKQGPKGSGCSCDEDASAAKAYGFDPKSREWCDRELVALGYVLT